MLLVSALVLVGLAQGSYLRCPTQTVNEENLDGYDLIDGALYSVWAVGMSERDAVMEELASGGEGGNKIGVGLGFDEYGIVTRLSREELHTLMRDNRVTGIDNDVDLRVSGAEGAFALPCDLGHDCTSCLTGKLLLYYSPILSSADYSPGFVCECRGVRDDRRWKLLDILPDCWSFSGYGVLGRKLSCANEL
jgi:hypothetical protein